MAVIDALLQMQEVLTKNFMELLRSVSNFRWILDSLQYLQTKVGTNYFLFFEHADRLLYKIS